MATHYLSVTPRTAGSMSSKEHGLYIAGVGKHDHKDEVIFCEDYNLPNFSKDGIEFFGASDDFERANGRTSRSIICAIPHESDDIIGWAKNFAAELIGDEYAYRLAVHDKPGNKHFHLMFCERPTNEVSLKMSPKKFFSRSNPKNRDFITDLWLIQAKEKYLKHIKEVAPTYVPALVTTTHVGPIFETKNPIILQNREVRIERAKEETEAAVKISQYQDVIGQLNMELAHHKDEPYDDGSGEFFIPTHEQVKLHIDYLKSKYSTPTATKAPTLRL